MKTGIINSSVEELVHEKKRKGWQKKGNSVEGTFSFIQLTKETNRERWEKLILQE